MKQLIFLFILGGLGERFIVPAVLISLAVGVVGLLNLGRETKRIKFPPHFNLYFVFLVLFQISVFWSNDFEKTILYFLYFVGSGIFWLLAFNLKKQKKLLFADLLKKLGVIFAFLYLLTLLGVKYFEPLTLFVPEPVYKNHNHLGDYWAMLVLVAMFQAFYAGKKKKLSPYIVLGIVLVGVSLSRSAYVAFGVGFFYLLTVLGKGVKKLFLPVVLAILLFLVLTSVYKGVYFPRPYYLQAIAGFWANPFGVGVGNFGDISLLYSNNFSPAAYSYLVHNLVLEIVVGMGIFSAVFIYWLYRVFWDVAGNLNKKNAVFGLVFIFLTVNFLVDTTYAIPTMLWIWFASLGFFQATKR